MAMHPLRLATSRALTVLGAACLLCGCGSDGATTRGVSPGYAYSPYAYHDWLYVHQYWYDDDFWIWADDHPECCYGRDDVKQAVQTWYDGLDPDQQQAVRDRVQGWMDANGVAPAAGQLPRELVLETASERWAALTPAERRQWLEQRNVRIEQRRAAGSVARPTLEQRAAMRERVAKLSPEQRMALRESGNGLSFNRASGGDRMQRAISNHPSPGRAGLARSGGFRGGGLGGRGFGGRGGGRGR
jgi:hypothetical protein